MNVMQPTELPFELDDDRDPEPAPVTAGRDILVVDDNQTNLVAIEAALLPLGRKLVLAHSGIEALARLLVLGFALIILGVGVPGRGGRGPRRPEQLHRRHHGCDGGRRVRRRDGS